MLFSFFLLTSLSFTMMVILTISLFFMVADGRCVCSWHEIQPLAHRSVTSSIFVYVSLPETLLVLNISGSYIHCHHFFDLHGRIMWALYACFFSSPILLFWSWCLFFCTIDDWMTQRDLIYRNWSCNRRKDCSFSIRSW